MSRRVESWDPAQYGKFAPERMRPVEDLLARLPVEAPATVCDLGCGDGRVTRLLAERWPGARITGVDNSAGMLAAARDLLPDLNWVEAEVVSDSWWKLVFGVAPDHDGCSIRRRGQSAS